MRNGYPGFPKAAAGALKDEQMRRSVGNATRTIRSRRATVVDEIPDWEELRDAGRAIKANAMARLGELLPMLEQRVLEAGGHVHWARDGQEANAIITELVRTYGSDEVIKVKSLVTDEIGLNDALSLSGVHATETDLAELIVQLAGDQQSHILVPAIHRSRKEMRDLLARELDRPDLGDKPTDITAAARTYLREKLLSVRVGISGANFAVAETGHICVVESEGNGRMCTTLPSALITVMGIEKVIPSWRDLEVMLQLLPASATGERMNPYTSLWAGTTRDDGPRDFHLVLLDNGRTNALADPTGRQALHCIRCSACLNVCPVYERVGGHAYGSIYPGPIGAILSPQLFGLESASTLPWASSLCGACYDVCPVKINIPEVLVHLRGRVVREVGASHRSEQVGMSLMARVFRTPRVFERAQRLARRAEWIARRLPVGPLRTWQKSRHLPDVPDQTFREWWRGRGS